MAFGISAHVNGDTPPAPLRSGESSVPLLPPTMFSKCGTFPGSTSVTVTSNGAYVFFTHSITFCQTASPCLYSVIVSWFGARLDVWVRESSVPGWTVQPRAIGHFLM